MAAVFAAVVNGATATSATTADYTKTGFGTPKAAIVLCARADSYDTAVSNGALSIGFWDSTTQVCYSCFAEGSGGFGDTTDFGYNNKIIALDNVDSALLFTGTVENITDGIRITYAGSGTWAAYKVTVILLNGADLQAKAGALALGTGTSAIEVSCGFQPDFILGTQAASNDGTHRSVYMYPTFGCAKDAGGGSTTHRCISMFQDQLTAMTNYTVVRTDCLTQKDAYGGRVWYLTASGWDSNGLDVTPSASTSSSYLFYLALDVGSANTWLGTVNPPTTASGAWDSPNTGFTPQLVILGQTLCDAVDSGDTASPMADTFGICAFDGTTEGSIAITEDDGYSDAAAKSYASERLAYLYDGTYTAPTLYYDIGNATMDSTGWTVADDEVDTANATTRYWWGLALEQSSGTTYQASASISGQMALTATAIVTHTASCTLANTGAVSAIATRTQPCSATIDATGAVSAVATVTHEAASTIACTMTLDAIGTHIPFEPTVYEGSATCSNDCSVTATATATQLASATIAATGELTATGTRIHNAASLISAAGEVSAAATKTQPCSSTLSATCDVTATGTVKHEANTTIACTMTLDAIAIHIPFGPTVYEGSATCSNACSVTATGIVTKNGSASIAATCDLVGTAIRVKNASATLTNLGALIAVAVRRREASVSIQCVCTIRAITGLHAQSGGMARVITRPYQAYVIPKQFQDYVILKPFQDYVIPKNYVAVVPEEVSP